MFSGGVLACGCASVEDERRSCVTPRASLGPLNYHCCGICQWIDGRSASTARHRPTSGELPLAQALLPAAFRSTRTPQKATAKRSQLPCKLTTSKKCFNFQCGRYFNRKPVKGRGQGNVCTEKISSKMTLKESSTSSELQPVEKKLSGERRMRRIAALSSWVAPRACFQPINTLRFLPIFFKLYSSSFTRKTWSIFCKLNI